MRRNSVISALLILMFATSAFGCVTGWKGPSDSCGLRGLGGKCVDAQAQHSAGKKYACSHGLRAQRGQCSLRSFVQFQYAAVPFSRIASPLERASGEVSPRITSVILISSIGSPETDRGPPRS